MGLRLAVKEPIQLMLSDDVTAGITITTTTTTALVRWRTQRIRSRCPMRRPHFLLPLSACLPPLESWAPLPPRTPRTPPPQRLY